MKRKFACAFAGIKKTIKRERSMRIHLAAAFYVLLAAAITGASRLEWCALLLCIGAVIAAELFNTAIENLCDALHPEQSERIGAVKDFAAGAVLVLAVISVIVGGIIFLDIDKIKAALNYMRNVLYPVGAIAAIAPVVLYLIFRRRTYDKQNSNDNDSGQAERGKVHADKCADRGEGGDSHTEASDDA